MYNKQMRGHGGTEVALPLTSLSYYKNPTILSDFSILTCVLIKEKKSDKTDCSNYKGISLLSTIYKSLSSNLLSRLTPYTEDIIVVHQCGFRCIRSTTDHIFCIRQILEKKWEYNEAVHQLFIELKNAYDSFRVEVLCNTLIEFGIPMKLNEAPKKVHE
jgi:hypothetical protein